MLIKQTCLFWLKVVFVLSDRRVGLFGCVFAVVRKFRSADVFFRFRGKFFSVLFAKIQIIIFNFALCNAQLLLTIKFKYYVNFEVFSCVQDDCSW